jgi:hypothetical protein
MTSVAPKSLNTHPFAEADLWQLGLEKNWEKLKKILAPVTNNTFAVTELKHRLLIDNIRRRFDSSKDSRGYTILGTILNTKAADKKRMADVADLVLSVGVHPDLPGINTWRPAHIVGEEALVELVSTIFACRPDMTALNSNGRTPLTASQGRYVSKRKNQIPVDPLPRAADIRDSNKSTIKNFFCWLKQRDDETYPERVIRRPKVMKLIQEVFGDTFIN